MVQKKLKAEMNLFVLPSVLIFAISCENGEMINEPGLKDVYCTHEDVIEVARSVFSQKGPHASVVIGGYSGIEAPFSLEASEKVQKHIAMVLLREFPSLKPEFVPAKCINKDGEVSYSFSVQFNDEMIKLTGIDRVVKADVMH